MYFGGQDWGSNDSMVTVVFYHTTYLELLLIEDKARGKLRDPTALGRPQTCKISKEILRKNFILRNNIPSSKTS